MSYEISQDCIACGNCSVVCPREAIDDGYAGKPLSLLDAVAGASGEGARFPGRPSVWQGYRITGACTECGACVEVCPTGAVIRKP